MTDTAQQARRRMRRAPHVLCTWQGTGRLVQSARRPAGVPASALILDVLDRLATWTSPDAVAAALDVPLPALSVLLEGLLAHDLIEVEPDGAATPMAPASSPWASWSPAAHLFHLATRDVTFARREGPAPSGEPAPRPPVVLPPRDGPQVPLPPPALGDESLRGALRDRRTHRRFDEGPIDLEHLATLLGVTFGAQAWVHAAEGPLALKTSPSGGARHSLEAYVWARDVSGIPSALYHYRPDDHGLTRLDGQPPASVTCWLPTQTGYESAGVIVVLASVLARVAWRYRSARAYRVVLIEAGHLAQTFCLTATALGLAPFCTAALADSAIEHDLGLDGHEQPVMYAVGAGRVVPGDWQPHEGRPAPRLEVTDLGRALADQPVTRRSG